MVPRDAQSANMAAFGPFELNLQTAELFRNGQKLPLSGRSAQLLALLVQQAGNLVSREHLRLTLWPEDTYGDFDHGLNNCISRIRQVIGDSVESPRYIDTLPKQGYRFVAEVRLPEPKKPDSENKDDDAVAPARNAQTPRIDSPEQGSQKRPWPWVVGGAFTVLAIVLGASLLSSFSSPVPIVEGVTQLTDDGNPKIPSTNLVADSGRIYFNETRQGAYTLAQVATSGGETSLVNERKPLLATGLVALAPDSSHLLLLGNESWPFAHLWILPLPYGEFRKLSDMLADDATFSSDGHLIIAKDKSLFIADGDGSNPRKLADFHHFVSSPVVSPDGKRIRLTIFSTPQVASIWELNTDGSGVHQFLQGWSKASSMCCGRWTPGGKYFVFANVGHIRSDLWSLREGTNWLGHIYMPVPLINGPLSYLAPYPSQDGKHIYAFGVRARGELVRYDGRSHQFVPFLSGISATDVTFSRDGKWITYQSYPDDCLWRSRADGSDRLQLTYPPTRAFLSRISPDGTTVAYGSWDANGNAVAYVLPIDGGTPRKIADEADIGVAWSPDSKSLIEVVTHSPNFLGLRTIDLQTGKITPIPNTVGISGTLWVSENMLVSAATDSGDFTNGDEEKHWKFITYDFRTRKWSDLVRTAMYHFYPSVDNQYLYYTTGGDENKVMRVRFSDRKVEFVASLKGFRGVEDAGWLAVTPDGSPIFTRDIGTDEIYDLSVRWP